MKEYWVDISGYLKIKANSPEEAERKWWDFVNARMNMSGDYSDDVWDIEAIEEVVNNG